MVTNANLGRLAISSIIAVFGFIALNRACGILPDVIVWWLFYCIGCGVVLNFDQGAEARTLAILSILPALIPVLMLGFFVMAEKPVCLSLPSPWIALLLPIASWFSIFVFTFARAPLSSIMEKLIRADTANQAKRAIDTVQIIIAGIAAIALSITSFGTRS